MGCGFGGLLIQLSTRYPDNLILGMEIRDKVCMTMSWIHHDHCVLGEGCVKACFDRRSLNT